MRTRQMGARGERVPVIGQGTWDMERDRQASVRALRRGLDLGMTHIDTAEMYGSGTVEEIVGEAIRGRRDEVYLVSKVLPGNASRSGTVRACERSLERLGTEALDLYLLHWPGPHPLEDTIAAFRELRAAGKIRAFGVSNFDVADLDEALRIAGEGELACNQALYHLGERGVEHAVLPWCRDHRVALVAYSPLGQGRFPGPRSKGGQVLGGIAASHGVSATAVALAFLTRDPAVAAIPKSSRLAHLEENARAADLELTDAERGRIERAFPRGKPGPLAVI